MSGSRLASSVPRRGPPTPEAAMAACRAMEAKRPTIPRPYARELDDQIPAIYWDEIMPSVQAVRELIPDRYRELFESRVRMLDFYLNCGINAVRDDGFPDEAQIMSGILCLSWAHTMFRPIARSSEPTMLDLVNSLPSGMSREHVCGALGNALDSLDLFQEETAERRHMENVIQFLGTTLIMLIPSSSGLKGDNVHATLSRYRAHRDARLTPELELESSAPRF
ncbi:hypothetical protein [Bosea sp. RAC05]|uniref:hypothetical protein n=1 Tax=Bosea sp. RAC05 TaxID=1842539 RepID=UPI000859246B|nr:hypothetical protein [Bosea sp. RAC05]AOG03173.1 hypothetical protein BSY19_4769 [Bosea sp. RAC05]